jgi:metal-responsive CopG/Arc/MetJ family transcriptional regulator
MPRITITITIDDDLLTAIDALCDSRGYPASRPRG